MIDVILALLLFTVIGWFIHKLFGKDGGILHYAFVGSAGSGLGMLLEHITGLYTTTIAGTIGLCLICACIVEFLVRRIKHKLWEQKLRRTNEVPVNSENS